MGTSGGYKTIDFTRLRTVPGAVKTARRASYVPSLAVPQPIASWRTRATFPARPASTWRGRIGRPHDGERISHGCSPQVDGRGGRRGRARDGGRVAYAVFAVSTSTDAALRERSVPVAARPTGTPSPTVLGTQAARPSSAPTTTVDRAARAGAGARARRPRRAGARAAGPALPARLVHPADDRELRPRDPHRGPRVPGQARLRGHRHRRPADLAPAGADDPHALAGRAVQPGRPGALRAGRPGAGGAGDPGAAAPDRVVLRRRVRPVRRPDRRGRPRLPGQAARPGHRQGRPAHARPAGAR